MDSLETAIREVLQDHAERIREESSDDLVARTPHATRPSHHIPLIAASAVVIAGLGAAVAAVALSGHASNGASRPALSSPVTLVTKGPSFCGSSQITAELNQKKLALASCAGLVGLSPTPELTAKVGQQITIRGLPGAAVLSAPVDVVKIQGDILLARTSGSTTLRVAGGNICNPITSDGTHCALLRVIVER